MSPLKLTAAEKRQKLEDYVRERMSPQEFARHLDVSTATAYSILNGKTWTTIERPPGFLHPWPDAKRNVYRRPIQMDGEQDRAWRASCFDDYVAERMSPKTFAEHVGIGMSHAYEVLAGKAWRDVPRPEGFEYPWPEMKSTHRVFAEREEMYRNGVRLWAENKWSYRQLARYMNVPAYTAWTVVQREFRASGKAEVAEIVAWLRRLAEEGGENFSADQAKLFADWIERGAYKPTGG